MPLGRFLLWLLERSSLQFGWRGFTLRHHEDFSTAIRVGLRRWFVGWIYCVRATELAVVDIISGEIYLGFPQSPRFMPESCLAYETDSNQGRWDVVGV
jgi:hypothetical protein